MKPSHSFRDLTLAACFFCAVSIPGSASSSPPEVATKLGVAVPYNLEIIDPLQQLDPINRLVLANVGRPLIRRQCNGDITPAIASSFSNASEKKEWNLSLRPNVTQSSGEALLPEDVVNSFSYLKQRAVDALGGRGRLAAEQLGSEKSLRLFLGPDTRTLHAIEEIDEIELTSQTAPMGLHRNLLQIRITSKGTGADLESVLSELPIINTTIAKVFGDAVGASTLVPAVGPFWIRSNTPDEGLLLERNPNFYDKSPLGSAVIAIKPYPDAAAALSALRTGVVELIFLPTNQLISLARSDNTLEVVGLPAFSCAGEKNAVPAREYWSDRGNEQDRLLIDSIIVRKGFKLDQKALENLDLSGSYLP